MNILDPTLFGMMTLVTSAHAMFHKLGRKHREKRLVGQLSRITIFPVKSMRGVDVQQAECLHTGLMSGDFYDRCFMVTNSKYDFISARTMPKLATIVATIENGTIHLRAHDNKTISVCIPSDIQKKNFIKAMVWEQTVDAIDCGQEVSSWLEDVLGKQHLHLLYHEPCMEKRHCDIVDSPWHKSSQSEDQVAFHDGFPYLLLSEESVHELNSRIRRPVSINYFRPNLIVDGCEAHAEDKWDKLYIGDVELFNIKPCHRCIMTTVNPDDGKKHPNMEPLTTMKGYRVFLENGPKIWSEQPTFGVNLTVLHPGVVKVGDPVYATLK